MVDHVNDSVLRMFERQNLLHKLLTGRSGKYLGLLCVINTAELRMAYNG